MFENEHGSPAFEEFLDFLGDRIELRGWSGFRGGMDIRGDTKGTHSVYTRYNKFEIMFHVSTLLPYHVADPLKLVRARQVQNDVVMILFLEGNVSYDPLIMPTNVTHVFAVINPTYINGELHYRFAIASKSNVSIFRPEIPHPAVFKKDAKFRDFLLTKVMNGQIATRKSGLQLMYTRPRMSMLNEIVKKYLPEKQMQKNES